MYAERESTLIKGTLVYRLLGIFVSLLFAFSALPAHAQSVSCSSYGYSSSRYGSGSCSDTYGGYSNYDTYRYGNGDYDITSHGSYGSSSYSCSADPEMGRYGGGSCLGSSSSLGGDSASSSYNYETYSYSGGRYTDVTLRDSYGNSRSVSCYRYSSGDIDCS